MNCIDSYIKEYQAYILTYAQTADETTLYSCSELGKTFALKEFSVEDVVTLHQACIGNLGHLLSDKQVIASFDVLTEVTVQQSLWLKREINLKSTAQTKISQQLMLEKSIISSFPDILIKLTSDLNVLDTNDHFNKLFPQQSFTLKADFLSLFEHQDDVLHLCTYTLNSKQRITRRMNLVSAEQQIFPCEVTFVLLNDVNQKNNGFLCIIRDLSEILQTSAQLEFAHQMIHDVIEAMPVRIYWKNNQHQYLGCNSTYLADVGLTNEQSLLYKTTTQLPDAVANIFLDLSVEEQVIEQIVPFHQLERQITLASKKQIFIKETIHPLKDLQGEIYGIICCYEDISEIKEKELENKRLTNNLNQSQRLESIGRLAGGIAHDFNNMLSVILGYSQLMERDKNIVNHQHKFVDYLGRISAAADKAKLLTEKLLTFSRKQVLQPHKIELYDHITQTLTTYASIIGEDIFISFNTSGEFWVHADANQIDQVILNLLVNARDAMVEKKSITQKRIELTLTNANKGKNVCLSVKDTGVGIPKNIQDQIFEPFFTTKRDIGTGLGLATVFGIVSQNNGDIVVNSEEGVGTEFLIYWPIDKNIKPANKKISGKRLARTMKKPSKSAVICIVEDEEPVRNLMESIISSHGYQVIAKESGHSLLHYLEYNSLQPALLISDVILSEGENGKEVSQQFSSRYPDSKVMFVSGYSNDLISKRGIILNGFSYLNKPFDIDKLISMIDGLLNNDPMTLN
jgi:signal transduction histidine kinase/ActR/RegA family two-component response regulator